MAKQKATKITKVRLGKKTNGSYEYSSKVDFGKDFQSQILNFIKEKKANDILSDKIDELKQKVGIFTGNTKKKNVDYYYSVGKVLSFLDEKEFEDIANYSVYKRIAHDVPDLLPYIDNTKVVQKHLDCMYRLAKIDRKYLVYASWDQWYEITKFEIYKKPRLLTKVLKEYKDKGPRYLRDRLNEMKRLKQL